MHASDLIARDIPHLRPEDTVARALDWMEEFKVSELPVVDKGRLVGLVRDQDLGELSEPRALVASAMASVEVPFVRDGEHIYAVMKVMDERGLTILPVLDMNGAYQGAVSEHVALRRLAEVVNIHEPGSVVVLEMNVNDYSLKEIARIVEGNDGKLLSVYSHTSPGTNRIEVTLKINREDISGILQTFERYEYTVRSTYQRSTFHDGLRGRYDELMRYING